MKVKKEFEQLLLDEGHRGIADGSDLVSRGVAAGRGMDPGWWSHH